MATDISPASLKPYLELRHHLSLTWVAYPVLSLLLVAFRVQTSLGSVQNSIASAKDNLIAGCRAAEHAATSAASMPRFMALATNEGFADTVNGSLNVARAALVLSLTAMQGTVNFVIDIYRSTYLCLLELVIRGGLAILIGAVKEFGDLIQTLSGGIASAIQGGINDANKVINGAIDAINKVNPFKDISAPSIPVPNLDALTNFTFPPTIENSLSKLNSTLPTFDDIKEKLEQVIGIPIEALKKDINDTFAGMSFDRSLLPVPQQNTVSFCNNLDTSIIDDLGRDLIKVARIGIIALIILALILIGLNCLLEWYKWRCQISHLEYTRQAWATDRTINISAKVAAGTPQTILTNHNLLIIQSSGLNPIITRVVDLISDRLRLSSQNKNRLSWYLHYIFHTPAVASFYIGFFGTLSVQAQFLALGPLRAKFAEKVSEAIGDFSNTIFTAINGTMYDESAAYANGVNGIVDAMQNTINKGLFGWVNGTTTAINSTINEVYDDIQKVVNTVFGGTLLKQPADEFLQCILGSKVDTIENVLTFMHDNLRVDIPRMNQSALVLSRAHVDEAVQPIAEAAIGTGESGDGGVVGRLVDDYASGLRQEQTSYFIFLGIWGVVCLLGLGFLLWDVLGPPRSERKRMQTHREWREKTGEITGNLQYPLSRDSEK
ncbi:hypothetical protein L218DRAFT_998862 [Marasmius fiardii PR-910]|nr:hypothetical protein L218DRAFT_998862 [Marasmius fiardii PR-910]